jgi:predicted outer membrane protein
MNTIKLLSTAALLIASATAFASQDDGNLDNAWLAQTKVSASAQAPAPTAAASTKSNVQTEAAIQQDSHEVAVP